ncbi:MAG: P-loop ATPase, Sll1717 family [bacterium]
MDKVDETELTGNDSEKTYKLIEPLLRDLDILGLKGYGFKFFLWDKIYSYYLKAARPDRVPQFSLKWSRRELEKMLSKRLIAFSESQVQHFYQVFEDQTDLKPDFVVSILGWLSPRNVIRFCDKTISHQLQLDTQSNHITFKALDQASISFSNEVSKELYGEDILRDLKRCGRDLFTVNYLANDVFKTSHQNTSRNKITEWIKSGAVKQVGSTQVAGSKKPSNLYHVLDPRIKRLIHQTIPLARFIHNNWVDCKHCNADILIDLSNLIDGDEVLCWNCDRPILS